MSLFFDISTYFSSVLFLATTILAFTWRPRKGKLLLCIFLSLLLTGNLLSYLFRFLDLDFGTVPVEIFQVCHQLLFTSSFIMLFLYVLLGRRGEQPIPSDLPAAEGTESPEPAPQVEHPELSGIGGWLILPAIGLVLSFILSIAGIVMMIVAFEDVADQGYGGYFALSIVLQIILLIFLIITAITFFAKKRGAPALVISLIIIGLVFSVITLMTAIATDEDLFIVAEVKDLLRSIIPAFIWIPYFLVSKRVKATFIH